MLREMSAGGVASVWAERLAAALPRLLREGALPLPGPLSVLLHGSTATGLDDEFSDLDLWALAPAEALDELDRRSSTRVLQFELDGKRGHLNLEDAAAFAERVERCDMPLLAELRSAVVLQDGLGVGAALTEVARRPMPEPVRKAWFQYHYVEMRGWHRTADNAVLRHDPAAVLLTMSAALGEALRAAMVLDGRPYPYPKWLAVRAARCPTGMRMVAQQQRLLAALEGGGLRSGDPDEAGGPGEALTAMRAALAERAQETGIDGDWLARWWLHIDRSRSGISDVRWPVA